MDSESSPLHVAMFPFLAFGHISPFVQLANKLASHGFRISLLSPTGNVSRLQSMLIPTPHIQIVPLRMPSIPGVSDSVSSTSDLPREIGKDLALVVDLMQPQTKTLLADLKPHFVVFDFAQYWLPPIASELGIKTLFFSVFSAISTAYITVPARLAGVNGTLTSKDLEKPPRGFPATSKAHLKEFQANNVVRFFTKSGDGLTGYERVMTGMNGCSAIIAKSCDQMEAPYLDFLRTQFKKNLLLTGPLVPEPPSGVLDEKWDRWLSQFPAKSVIFCAFGSETFLQDDQIKELASGLEQTGLPFFLVLNFPASSDIEADLERALPVGFLERVKNRGVVVTGWIQQPLILAHSSVGCYVCHSGFSSVIEAIMNDSQLVLLPLKGDQFLNAQLVASEMQAGVEVNRRGKDGYFGRDDICEAVKLIMADKEKEPERSIRANHQKWKEFLLNKEVHDDFITSLVEELKAMAAP